MIYRLLFILIPLSLILTRCAKQTQPTGGPKDEIPPTLIESNPDNRQTNFTKNEIDLTFDEAIQINNAREQIIITPSIGKKFELVSRKNKATLKLNADLQENTTYTIAFREAIQDLTEKNPAQNLKIAFSTGDYIDSLALIGKVYNLMEGKPVKNFTVAAVPYSDTTDIFKHEALWITLTNDKGEYQLENLKTGSYILYAFEDKNKNLIVESKTELYGFIGTPVVLDSSNLNIDIPVIKLDTRPFKIIVAKPLSTYFNIRLSKGFSFYSLKSDEDKMVFFSQPEDESTIKVYNTLNDKDSVAFRFHAADSINNTIDTLLYLKFEKKTSAKDKFTSKIEETKFHTSTSQLSASINFTKPVLYTKLDSIYIQLDSLNFIHIEAKDTSWNKYFTKLTIIKKLPKETDFSTTPQSTSTRNVEKNEPAKKEDVKKSSPEFNQLILPANTFISIEGDSSIASKSTIQTIKPENTGILDVEVITNESVIIQLVDKSNKLRNQSTSKKTRFDNLSPGDYQIRVILDKNSNGKWDLGNYYTKQEPEPILFYLNEKGMSTITIKANWEVGPLLITPPSIVDK
jgi:uncharacterized protein (DUF2141 family)